MTLQEYLDNDKEKLMEDLRRAGTPERASSVLEQEMDRLLLQYNENCESEEGREAAAYMLQTVRSALPLVDTAGEVAVWEKTGSSGAAGRKDGAGGAASWLPAAFGVLACICGVFAMAAGMSAAAGNFKLVASPMAWGLLVLGLLAAWLCGRAADGNIPFFGKGKSYAGGRAGQGGTAALETEIKVDPGKIWRGLRAAVLTMDRNLQDLASALAWKQRKAGAQGSSASKSGAGSAPLLTSDGSPVLLPDTASGSAQLELFSGLLEAYQSGDGQYALDRLGEVKYYLHQQGVEAVEYSEDHAAWFDVLPSEKTATIRPALVRDGKLLKKGMAVKN